MGSVVAAVSRIEGRVDSIDESMTRSIGEAHAHIDRSNRDMESRVDMRARQNAADVVEAEGRIQKEISKANRVIGETTEQVAETRQAVEAATSGWRTIVGIGGFVGGGAALIVCAIEIVKAVR